MTTAVMTPSARRIAGALPGLRRYAHALTGNRRLGDRYIEVALAVLAEEPWHVRESGDVRCQLLRLIHGVLDALWTPVDEPAAFTGEDPRGDLAARLQTLPLPSRKLVLLTAVEGLSLACAAELVGLPPPLARVLLARARMALAEALWKPNLSAWSEQCRSLHSELARI